MEANCKGVSFPSESGVACCYHEGGASFAGYDGCINLMRMHVCEDHTWSNKTGTKILLFS